ncbi:S-adenosylmethionine synthetase [Spraguea lophii 42_110]|uniref:S-adenosylmethionine synthase n=1 Tax=Spraguea lophii (strain 42_110) TaxID=1358809 RepID=S7XSK7_SPRLO|nr:S-adenosylmethionine synthetase [Spraguea lophii 42_110]
MKPMCLKYLFTSESVSEGHPDKICDQISDAILDAYLEIDPYAKVAIEATISPNLLLICGEVNYNSDVHINIEKIAKDTIAEIGYNKTNGFNIEESTIIVNVNKQSDEINRAVGGLDENMGAGDQGMMFGYATDETEERMPLSLMLSHKLIMKLSEMRRSEQIKWLRPDAKTQVTVEYDEINGILTPFRVDTIVVSAQHDEHISLDEIRTTIMEKIIKKVIPVEYLINTKYHILPSGKFVKGGPQADCGLTGRKIIVDTYGGFGCHGGGCFSGKDPSKVDRSGAYAARWIAKSLVDSKICKRALIQISYAIGIPEPVSIYINTYNTSKLLDAEIIEIIRKNFKLNPGDIIKSLELNKPIYKKTAVFGHFGRNEFSWEKSKKLEFDKTIER